MDRNKRYTLAGIIFALLLVYRVYSFNLITQNIIKGLYYEPQYIYISGIIFEPFIICYFWCPVLCIISLLILSFIAFRRRNSKRIKVICALMFVAGTLLPLYLLSLRLIMPRTLVRILIIFILFFIALFRLMENEGDIKMEKHLQTYKDLLKKGVISASEYQDIERRMKGGKP